MFYKFILLSPDGAGGGSGEPNPGDAGGGTPAADEKLYTAKDLEEAKRRSFSSGLNETRKRDLAPLVAKAKESGFDIEDLNDSTFTSILSDAVVGKKSASYNQEAKKKVEETEAKYNSYVSRYNSKVINEALRPYVKNAIDETDVLKLIASEMNFKVVEENGKEVVKVTDANGAPIRVDGFTDITLDEAVKGFLQRKPHLLQPSGRAAISTGSASKGGVVIEGRSLEEVVQKPNQDWTESEKKEVYKGLKEGRVKAIGGVLTVLPAK